MTNPDNDTPLRTTAEERAKWERIAHYNDFMGVHRRTAALIIPDLLADIDALLARAEAAEAEVARLSEELEELVDRPPLIDPPGDSYTWLRERVQQALARSTGSAREEA